MHDAASTPYLTFSKRGSDSSSTLLGRKDGKKKKKKKKKKKYVHGAPQRPR